MKYLSSIPINTTLDTKCIIMLHGVGSNESDLFGLADQFGGNTMILSLRGPFGLGIGRFAWYRVDFSTGKPIYKTQDVERGYDEIISCIHEVGEKYGIKSENIFLMGFSQGAIMSYYTLWKSPEKIGGIIALSGRLLTEIDGVNILEEKYREKRVFIGHGELDTVIPFSASEVTQEFIKKLGIIPEFHSYPAPHTITEREIGDIVTWLE